MISKHMGGPKTYQKLPSLGELPYSPMGPNVMGVVASRLHPSGSYDISPDAEVGCTARAETLHALRFKEEVAPGFFWRKTDGFLRENRGILVFFWFMSRVFS